MTYFCLAVIVETNPIETMDDLSSVNNEVEAFPTALILTLAFPVSTSSVFGMVSPSATTICTDPEIFISRTLHTFQIVYFRKGAFVS